MYENTKELLKKHYSRFGFTSHQYPNAVGLWPNEQESLLWLCLNSNPIGDWMEIGAFCGGSAVLMCIARRILNAKPYVVSVDKTFEDWGGAFKRNVYRVGKFNDISKIIECDSENLDKHYGGRPISFAFIDGWHSFRAILRDFNKIRPWLTDDAIIAFHDTVPQPYKPGQLKQFYDFAKQNYDKLINSELYIDFKTNNVTDYHKSEQMQDFLIDEAVAYICYEYGYELVNIPVLDGATHFDRVKEYKRGTTSPYHGMVAIRKGSLYR